MKEIPILYSTGCPKCKYLKQLLDGLHIEYVICDDVEHMLNLGLDRVPVLFVDNMYLNYNEAVEWISSQKE